MSERSRTRYTILGMLTFDSMSGYEIVKAIKESTNHFWSESEGQIYPALSQCVKEELVTCIEESAMRSHNIKKTYSITTKGRELLSAWLKKEVQPTSIRNELLLKIFFGNHVDRHDTIHHITRQQKKLEVELHEYKKIYQELKINYKDSPNLPYWLMTLDLGVQSAETELLWCEKSLSLLRSE